jgi:hypothetical protein
VDKRQELTEELERVRSEIIAILDELRKINEEKLALAAQSRNDAEFFSRSADFQRLARKQQDLGPRFKELRERNTDLEKQVQALDAGNED